MLHTLISETHDMAQLCLQPINLMARGTERITTLLPFPLQAMPGIRAVRTAADVLERRTRSYSKPEFHLAEVNGKRRTYQVCERVVLAKPFARLLHFETARSGLPRILVFAPLSGHHATLLRDTVAELLRDHDVYITDWIDAKLVPLSEGKFDFHDYVDYAREFMEFLGPDLHVVSVCQPTVPVLAAAALMAEDGSPYQPKSLTLMGGPIDTRINPTEVNKYAQKHERDWFYFHCIYPVSSLYPGAGRKVYPGFLQLGSFVGMNLTSHIERQSKYIRSVYEGEKEEAEAYRHFYDEYEATLDMTAEFYLDTVEIGFQKHLLPRGQLRIGDRLVRPEAISRVHLLVIEGERDDISGPGQTKAALDLCRNVPRQMKKAFLAKDCGHYGIFSGSRWRNTIYPVIRDFIAKAR